MAAVQSPVANAGGQSIGVALRWNASVAAVFAVLQPVAASGVGKIGSGGPIWDLFSPPEGANQAHVTPSQ